jgi:hypothetical protein
MIRRIFLILSFILLLCSTHIVRAQNPGYMGKHFMVKMNVINGARPIYIGGEVEYTFHKRFTVGVGAGWQTSMYRQLYFQQSAPPYYSYYGHYTGAGTQINSTWVYGQLKYFFPGGLMTAPQGLYLSAKAGAGNADIYSNTGKAISISSSYSYKTFEVKGISFGFYQLGLGYQRIVAKRLVLDASASFDIISFNAFGTNENKPYTSTLATEFGPNIIWPFSENTKYRTNIELNYGMSLYFKMGVLIF